MMYTEASFDKGSKLKELIRTNSLRKTWTKAPSKNVRIAKYFVAADEVQLKAKSSYLERSLLYSLGAVVTLLGFKGSRAHCFKKWSKIFNKYEPMSLNEKVFHYTSSYAFLPLASLCWCSWFSKSLNLVKHANAAK